MNRKPLFHVKFFIIICLIDVRSEQDGHLIEEVLQALFKFKRDISFPAVRCFSIDSVILDLASRACYFSFSLSGFMLCVEYRNIDVLCLFSELKSKHHMKITEDAEDVLDNYIDTKKYREAIG